MRFPFGPGSIELPARWHLHSWELALRESDVVGCALPTLGKVVARPQASITVAPFDGHDLQDVLAELGGKARMNIVQEGRRVLLDGSEAAYVGVELTVGPGKRVAQYHLVCGPAACPTAQHLVGTAWIGDKAALEEIPALLGSYRPHVERTAMDPG